MRTLSRPMFNMGGPIKQGIMHGIREPYKHGGPTGTGLVGDQRYPKTGGREHHVLPLAPILWGMARLAARPFGRYVMSQVPRMQALKFAGKKGARKVIPGKIPKRFAPDPSKPGTKIKNIMDKETFTPYKFWANDPLYKAAVAGSGVAGKAIRGTGKLIKGAVTTPTGLATTGLTAAYFWPDGTPKTTTELIEDNVVKGDKDYGPHTKGDAIITASARDAKAKADKEKRINDLLDTMGYDKARKNAAYDALMDAGRMISERGTLDPKNIGRELIDPIIASTSARFDKPQQIREAVGLMKVKADIAKQLEDPQVAKLRGLEIEKSEKALAGPDFKQVITDRIIKNKPATGTALAQIYRATEGKDAQVIPTTSMPQDADALTYLTTIVETSHKEGNPHPAGTFVIKDRIVTVDEQGNVKVIY
jgi:hypothetical protein